MSFRFTKEIADRVGKHSVQGANTPDDIVNRFTKLDIGPAVDRNGVFASDPQRVTLKEDGNRSLRKLIGKLIRVYFRKNPKIFPQVAHFPNTATTDNTDLEIRTKAIWTSSDYAIFGCRPLVAAKDQNGKVISTVSLSTASTGELSRRYPK